MLNIKNPEVDRLVGKVSNLSHETKTEAIRQSLEERLARLEAHSGKVKGRSALRDYLEKTVWPLIPPNELGRTMTREEEDQILGYGPRGF